MKKFILIFSVLCSIVATAQDSIRIQGHLINNAIVSKVVVLQFKTGSGAIAAVTVKDNKFKIAAPLSVPAGVYRLQYNQTDAKDFMDVIVDGKEKEINFSVDVSATVDKRKPVFTASEENKKWYDYQYNQKLQLQKISTLQNALAFYPETKDKIILQLQKAYNQEKNNYEANSRSFIEKNKDTWAGNMVKNRPIYFTDYKQDWRLQDFELRAHYWDNVNTTNPELINSPLYTERILEYLRYYMNPKMNFTEEEMNEGFKKSVDVIMEKFSGNKVTQEFALNYLQLGFKEIANEKVLQYIDEKYQKIAEQCKDNTTEQSDFDKRMAGYAAMKEGEQAPDIVLANNTTLYDVQSERTIVVFWASWCPHCMEELPKINTWAATNTATKVVAISLDDDKTAYENAIIQFPNLAHHTDLKKWDGKAANDYYICATPTFIVLDKDKKIVGKYADFKAIINLYQ